MRSNVANLWRKIYPEKVDQFDRLPDEIILSIFNRIGDATALGRCCAVSRRFHSIVPQVDDIVIHVGSIILEEEDRELASSPPRHPIASFFRILFSGLFNPLLSLAQLIIPSARLLPLLKEDDDETVSLCSMKNVLKNFNEIKRLWIELSAGEVAINDGVLLKLKAEYSVANRSCSCDDDDGADLDSLHESFYSDEGLEQRVVWISNRNLNQALPPASVDRGAQNAGDSGFNGCGWAGASDHGQGAAGGDEGEAFYYCAVVDDEDCCSVSGGAAVVRSSPRDA